MAQLAAEGHRDAEEVQPLLAEQEEDDRVGEPGRDGEGRQDHVPRADGLVAGEPADPPGVGEHAPTQGQTHEDVGKARGQRGDLADADVVLWQRYDVDHSGAPCALKVRTTAMVAAIIKAATMAARPRSPPDKWFSGVS